MSGAAPWWSEDRAPLPARRYLRECPKCVARNRERTRTGKDPLPGRIRVRSSDGALWCYCCAEMFSTADPLAA